MNRLGYRPALDGVRGLAIALVVLVHTLGFPASGGRGVDLFFVLSGFLITTLLLEEHARDGRVSYRAFYRRRALRLLPALFVVLGVFLFLATLGVVAREDSLRTAVFGVVAGVGYFSNFAMTLEPDVRVMPLELSHLWSLAIEEQFYVLWPVALFAVLRARLKLAVAVLAAGILLAFVQQVRLYAADVSDERIAFGSDTRSTSILVGCLFAVLLVTSARSRLEAIVRLVWPLAAVGFVALVFVHPGRWLFTGPLLLFAVCAGALIVLALDGESRLGRALSVPPLVFLGRISYALYLWHIPIYVCFGLGLYFELADLPALALALGCATASYYVVEQPFLRRKYRHSPEMTAEHGRMPTAVTAPT